MLMHVCSAHQLLALEQNRQLTLLLDPKSEEVMKTEVESRESRISFERGVVPKKSRNRVEGRERLESLVEELRFERRELQF